MGYTKSELFVMNVLGQDLWNICPWCWHDLCCECSLGVSRWDIDTILEKMYRWRLFYPNVIKRLSELEYEQTWSFGKDSDGRDIKHHGYWTEESGKMVISSSDMSSYGYDYVIHLSIVSEYDETGKFILTFNFMDGKNSDVLTSDGVITFREGSNPNRKNYNVRYPMQLFQTLRRLERRLKGA